MAWRVRILRDVPARVSATLPRLDRRSFGRYRKLIGLCVRLGQATEADESDQYQQNHGGHSQRDVLQSGCLESRQ